MRIKGKKRGKEKYKRNHTEIQSEIFKNELKTDTLIVTYAAVQ